MKPLQVAIAVLLLISGNSMHAAARPPNIVFIIAEDLEKDPAETTNMAARHPDVVARLRNRMEQQYVKSDLFPIRALDARP